MPYYNRLRYAVREKAERARVIANLQALSRHLDASVPAKDADNNLLLASWNIRDFGKPGSRRGFGRREPETLFYIAEVLSRFDFIAIQEINELDEFEGVMRILGPDWDYITTDVTDPKLGGNGERLTYCFDKRKMWFQNVSGEIVLPQKMLISQALVETDEGKKLYAGKQFRRTPFITRFQAGWFKFDVCTVHLYYGAESGDKLQERVEEIDRVARYFGGRAERAAKEGRALILLGDFNIVHPEHKTMQALLDAGFRVPRSLQDPTNFSGTKYYDQIALVADDAVLARLDEAGDAPQTTNAGVVDIFAPIYRPEQWSEHRDQMRKSPTGKKKANDAELQAWFRQWLTYQWSDHRPLWVRISTDNSEDYLEKMRQDALA